MRKRILSILLCLCVMATFTPTIALAAVTTHDHVCSESCGHVSGDPHKNDGITWSAWTDDSSLPGVAGNYYLATDVTLNSQWDLSTDVTLCLNGHTINLNGKYIDLKQKVLTITDCGTEGKITGGNGKEDIPEEYCGGAIFVSGTLNFYAGTITGNSAGNGGAVYITGMSTFNMYGGSITNNTATETGGGVQFNGGNFNISGAVTLSGNKVGSGASAVDSNVHLYTGKTITVSGTLSNTQKIGITTQTAPTASSPVAITGTNSSNISKYFTSDNAGYEIYNDSNTVKLRVKPVEIFDFGYVYDAQRRAVGGSALVSYPSKGTDIQLFELENPYTPADSTKYESKGTWTLTRVGAYSEMVSPSANLQGIVDGVKGGYGLTNTDSIVIHELKNGGTHYAYGVLLAYDGTKGKALFVADLLGRGGAGCLLSTTEVTTATVDITVGKMVTDIIDYSISLSKTGTHTFTAATEGYAAQTPLTVTVTNTGNKVTGALNVTLSGTNADKFELSKSSLESLAIGGNTTFTVAPKTGLAAGEYTALINVSNTNVLDKTFNVKFKVNGAITPNYGITLSQTSAYEFAAVEEGYAAQTPLTVTVTNSGDTETGALNVAVSGTDADKFEVSPSSLASIAVSGNTTFTVTPKTGLAAGEYTATITVSNTNITNKTFDVKFTVEEAAETPSGSAYTPKKSEVSVEISGGTNIKTEVLNDGTKVKSSTQGTVSVNKAGNAVTITPSKGYEIESVKLNGLDKGKVDTLTGLKSTDKVVVKFKAVEKTVSSSSKLTQAKKLVDKITLTARSTKDSKKNIKVTLKTGKQTDTAIKQLKSLGYTVKYKFYRSEKKSSKYVATVTKSGKSYTNTTGKADTKYYYKARVQVFDKNGKLVTQTALKQCKYASRTWTKE